MTVYFVAAFLIVISVVFVVAMVIIHMQEYQAKRVGIDLAIETLKALPTADKGDRDAE